MRNIILASYFGLKLALFLYYVILLLLDCRNLQDMNNYPHRMLDYLQQFCNLLIVREISLFISQPLLIAGFIFYYGSFFESIRSFLENLRRSELFVRMSNDYPYPSFTKRMKYCLEELCLIYAQISKFQKPSALVVIFPLLIASLMIMNGCLTAKIHFFSRYKGFLHPSLSFYCFKYFLFLLKQVMLKGLGFVYSWEYLNF